VADELTFSDLVDFLSDREGQKVYVEIGTRDQEARERDTDEFIAVDGSRRTSLALRSWSCSRAASPRRTAPADRVFTYG
jgi:hypothetical protein